MDSNPLSKSPWGLGEVGSGGVFQPGPLSQRRAARGCLEQGLLSSLLQATLPLSWLPFPKPPKPFHQLLCILEGLTKDQGPGPLRLHKDFFSRTPSLASGATGHVESLWQTPGAAEAFGSFAHFINKCALVPTTWRLMPGNRNASLLWGAFWLDHGGRSDRDRGGVGRGEAGGLIAQFRATGGIQGPLEFVKTFWGKGELGGT